MILPRPLRSASLATFSFVVLTLAVLTATLLLAVLPAQAVASTVRGQSLDRTLTRLAPNADPAVLRLAAHALACASANARRLAVIDYSRPSTARRLWVFDLARPRLLFEELVSHGRGSGDIQARAFSNQPESYQSSLGLFRTLDSYQGHNGYSLRLEGLEPGINDRAYQRAIVIHGADYVSESFIERTGHLGRSQGCPAVRREVTRPLIDSIKGDQYLFAYYPDQKWLANSALLSCADDRPLASR